MLADYLQCKPLREETLHALVERPHVLVTQEKLLLSRSAVAEFFGSRYGYLRGGYQLIIIMINMYRQELSGNRAILVSNHRGSAQFRFEEHRVGSVRHPCRWLQPDTVRELVARIPAVDLQQLCAENAERKPEEVWPTAEQPTSFRQN